MEVNAGVVFSCCESSPAEVAPVWGIYGQGLWGNVLLPSGRLFTELLSMSLVSRWWLFIFSLASSQVSSVVVGHPHLPLIL